MKTGYSNRPARGKPRALLENGVGGRGRPPAGKRGSARRALSFVKIQSQRWFPASFLGMQSNRRDVYFVYFYEQKL